MSRLAFRVLFLVSGFACVACEMWGSYEYMIEKHGHWNYLVAGSLVLTSLGALLPIAAEYARREGMHGRKWAVWLAIPLALAFVFTVSIQRTGSDIDEASRQQIAAAVAIAEKEQEEAEKQLVIDQQMVASNCDVIGPKCKAAMDAKAPTEAKLAGARAVLKRASSLLRPCSLRKSSGRPGSTPGWSRT